MLTFKTCCEAFFLGDRIQYKLLWQRLDKPQSDGMESQGKATWSLFYKV